MARSMWKGAIQFGLVTIPVKLYTATESEYTIRFNMLHETDLSRIQMKVWCPEDEKVISRGETVKGYEYAPDQYVVITDEDLEKVPLKTVRSIEIEQFAPRDDDDRGARQVHEAVLLHRARQDRPQGVLPAAAGARGARAHRDLQGRHPGPRGARGARPVRGHDAPHDPPLARRDPVDQGAGPAGRGVRVQAGRDQDGRAAGRGDDRSRSTRAATRTSTARRCSRSSRPRSRASRSSSPSRSRRAPTSSTS